MFHLFKTDEGNRALLIQRLLLALVIFPHGAQKLFGWFGGYGFSGFHVRSIPLDDPNAKEGAE